MQNFIYRFLDQSNNITYIGKTNDIERRIDKEHFSKNGHLSYECYYETNKVEYAALNSEIEATIYELYLINIHKPRYNVANNTSKEKTEMQLQDLQWIEYKRKDRPLDDEKEQETRKQHVIARLRPVKDDDIKSAMSKLPIYYDEADIVRESLRQFLFGHHGREPRLLGSQVFKEKSVWNG